MCEGVGDATLRVSEDVLCAARGERNTDASILDQRRPSKPTLTVHFDESNLPRAEQIWTACIGKNATCSIVQYLQFDQ